MQETIEPATQAGWNARDKQLMSNLPYAQAQIPDEYKRHIVDYTRKEAAGTIVVDSDNKFLYYVLPKGQAIRYGIAVGEEAQAWSGIAKVGRMEEWPAWVPTPGEQERLGPLPAYVTGGPHNPLGARGMYLYSGNKDTLYRIHGTNQPEYIGQAISSGCIRMTNEDAIDLYNRVKVGTIVVDSDNKFLYYVLPKGEAIRYGIAVGEEAQAWSGIAKIGRMEEWPAWVPTPGEQERLGPLPAYVTGGPHNPLGARGMYLYSGNKDTLYRIHGTNQPEYIGQAISSGCIRMTNEDAIDLYNRVKVGTIVVVLAPKQGDAPFSSQVATATAQPNRGRMY